MGCEPGTEFSLCYAENRLDSFEDKALYCLRNTYRMSQLRDAVDELATFWYLSSVRKEKRYKSPHVEVPAEMITGKLTGFSVGMNGIETHEDKSKTITNVFRNMIDNLTQIREIRGIGLFIVASTVVMYIGTRLFSVDSSTAFLAWFAAVFGYPLVTIVLKALSDRGR
ncbi:MAG: hypothetical protein ACE5LU_20965, partial [Anaerolineae bacterium]